MASNEEIKKIFRQFEEANQRLKESCDSDDGNPLKQDAVIKRFEFTYELLWKLYKKIARSEKIECYSPKESFKFAFKAGLISDEKLFFDIIDARNMTTHVYSEDQAMKIYKFIRETIAPAFKDASAGIKDRID